MAQVCFSSITEAELLFGLAVKTQATKFAELVNQFLLDVSVLPWDSAAAKAYADLCAASSKRGRPLAAMDTLVAAHASRLTPLDATLTKNRGVGGRTPGSVR